MINIAMIKGPRCPRSECIRSSATSRTRSATSSAWIPSSPVPTGCWWVTELVCLWQCCLIVVFIIIHRAQAAASPCKLSISLGKYWSLIVIFAEFPRAWQTEKLSLDLDNLPRHQVSSCKRMEEWEGYHMKTYGLLSSCAIPRMARIAPWSSAPSKSTE